MENDFWSTLYEAAFSDLPEGMNTERPLLAHYTSLEVLESIARTEEIWLSNPLLMNDFEEVRFGINQGSISIKSNLDIREALQTEARHQIFVEALDNAVDYYAEAHLLDTYVFCLSKHTLDDTDGLLSMWRGYGGLGRGVAIIFDTSKISPVLD